MKKNKRMINLIIIVGLLILFVFSNNLFSDDVDLFTAKVKPNVMFLMDNSGSMNTVIFHPHYNIKTDYYGTVDDAPYYVSNTTTLTRYVCDRNMRAYTRSKYCPYYCSCRTVTVTLYGTKDHGQSVRYPYNYLQWIFFYASSQDIEEINHFATHGTFDTSDNTVYESRYTRIQVARQVLQDIADRFYKKVKLGLFNFNGGSDPAGGYVTDSLSDKSEEANGLTDFKAKISNVVADTWTPLAESLADIWKYYKGVNNYWPNSGQNIASSCPVEYWCQKNFVIIMTDGESTKDDFSNSKYSSSIFRDTPISQWGDGDDHDPTNTDGGTYCPNNSCWYSDGTDYLDDIAYYINQHDMFPDDLYPDYPEKQNIITYTVGFSIDNDMLRDTALNGDGYFYTASDYDSLFSALEEALFDIIQRSYSFSSFTAPKKITTAGTELNVSFVGSFIPKPKPVWEGHVKAYDVNEDGSFGNERWDAADKIPAPSQRNLYTYDGVSDVIEFSTDNLSTLKPLLDVSTDSDATRIINFIRGDRATFDPPYKLGDLFHSDIQFIGAPLVWKKALDSSYETFYENHKNRKKVIYFGTNDGILHQVDADPEHDPSSEGKEIYGFIPDEILPKLKKIVLDGKHQITVDGRISADDIFYTSGGEKIWRTMIYFGLRDGGKAYYALDVSDPDNPTFKWKFGRVSSGTQPSYVQYLGYSWGKPAVGMIKYKTSSGDIVDKYVVILTGGYADNGGDSSDLEGKAIFIVDAWTGDLLWMLGYATSDEQTSDHYLTSDEAYNYPIPSSLTAIDLNNDNYIDTLYFGNTYGNLFKLDISDPDTSNWEPVILFKATYGRNDPLQPIFLSPAVAYDNCYNLWVTFGTGDRTNMKTNDKGRLVAIKDSGSTEIELSDLQEITWSGDTFETNYDETKKGFYFDFPSNGEKIFDPDPIILPDDDMVPHLYFNTYRLPPQVEDPCTTTGEMTFYDIKISACPTGKLSGEKEGGRIAGGGFFKGKEYIMYEGTPELGSTTVKKVKKISLPYAGGLVYWKERRR